jgi:hypothetical protein
MVEAFKLQVFTELVKRETKLSVKTKTKVSDQELQLLKGR